MYNSSTRIITHKSFCKICGERILAGDIICDVICKRHETEPMDARWDDCPTWDQLKKEGKI